MKTWSFYDRDGRFAAKKISARDASPAFVAANTPPGFTAIEGNYDRKTQRFDFESGRVVTDQSMVAQAEELTNRERRRAVAMKRILELEAKQARPIRELAIDPNNAEARRRLDEIEAQIAAARSELSETDTTARRG